MKTAATIIIGSKSFTIDECSNISYDLSKMDWAPLILSSSKPVLEESKIQPFVLNRGEHSWEIKPSDIQQVGNYMVVQISTCKNLRSSDR